MATVIPIGIDCGVAMFLRDEGMRGASFPFDWAVSYSGVSECVRNDFAGLLPAEQRDAGDEGDEGSPPPSAAGVHFVHNRFPQDTSTLRRRVQRFRDALSGQLGPLAFIRKGHLCFHHEEAAALGVRLCDDVADSEALAAVLAKRYPLLPFRVEVLVMCRRCYAPGQVVTPTAARVYVHNIVLPDGSDVHLRAFLRWRLRPATTPDAVQNVSRECPNTERGTRQVSGTSEEPVGHSAQGGCP